MQPFANNSPKSILRTLRMKSILQNIFQSLASRGDTDICLKKREYLQSIKSLKARIVVAVLYPGGMPREKLPCRRLEDNTPRKHYSIAIIIKIPMCFGFIGERFIILHVPKILRLDFSFGLWSQSLERESRGTKGSMEGEHYTNLKHLELLHSTRIHLTHQC